MRRILGLRMLLRTLLILSLVVGIGLLEIRPVQATTNADQLCLLFDEFIDTVLLNVQIGAGPATFFLINARLRGLGAYQLTGAGTVTLNSEDATNGDFPWQMDVSLGHGTIFFNGNPNCMLHWLFRGGNEFMEGPADLTCTGPNPAFVSHGTLRWDPECLGHGGLPVAQRDDGRPLLGHEDR